MTENLQHIYMYSIIHPDNSSYGVLRSTTLKRIRISIQFSFIIKLVEYTNKISAVNTK